MMQMRWAGRLACSVMSGVVVAGVSAAGAAAANEREILVIQSMTGPAAFAAVPALNGMLLAIDEINASGYLGNGDTIVAHVEDDSGDRNQTFAIVNNFAVGNPDILALLGPTGISIGTPTGGLANELRLPMLAFVNTASILETGEYTFMSHEGAATSTPILANYAYADNADRTCGMIYAIDNDAYASQARVFMSAFTALGGTIADQIEIRTTDNDFAAAATRLASLTMDCVFVATPAAPAANLVRQLRTAGLDPETNVYGSTSMVSVDFVTMGGGAVEGVTMLGDWVPGRTELGLAFIQHFTEEYGQAPDNWAAVGYTMAYVLANAIRNAGSEPTRDSVRAALAATTDVPVILGNGLFSYDPVTRVPLTGATIMRVQGGAHVVVEH